MHEFIRKINRTIVKAEEVAIVVLMGAIVLIMTMQVTMRYVFGSPITWSQELAILLLIYLSFLSADVVMYRKGHIGISYFVEHMPVKVRDIVTILVQVMIVFAMCMIVPKAIVLMEMQAGHVVAGVLPLSKSFWIFPLPLVFTLMILKSFEMIYEGINDMRNNKQKEGA